MDLPANAPQSTKPPLWFGVLLCALMVALMAWLRLDLYAHTSVPIAFGVPIAIAGWTRNRRLIWGLVCIFIAMTAFKIFYVNPNSPTPLHQRIINISLLIGDTIVVAFAVDLLVQLYERLEHRSWELEDQKQRLQTILDTVPLGIALASVGQSQMYLNPTAERMLGLTDRHADRMYRFPEDESVWRNGVQLNIDQYALPRAVAGEQISDEEVEIRLRSGGRFIALVSASPIRDRAGVIVGAVSAFVDITPLKQLQEEFDRRRRNAEEEAQRKSRFLAVVSHDIRSPANAISLLAELILRTAKDPKDIGEIPELARELQRSSLSLVHLVSDVLDLSRLDAGGIQIHETEFEASQWIGDECRQLQPLAEQKKLQFDFSAPPSMRLRADRIKMSRVLNNLVGNAIKFTESGQVHVTAERLADGRLRITVADTGIGIEPENLPRIFDEFFQLKNPGRERKGSGLGLSISKRLVEVMGGQLEVSSEPGKGSTFSVTLPASLVVG
jgi:two-component system sensor histidine kinase/response regulator